MHETGDFAEGNPGLEKDKNRQFSTQIILKYAKSVAYYWVAEGTEKK